MNICILNGQNPVLIKGFIQTTQAHMGQVIIMVHVLVGPVRIQDYHREDLDHITATHGALVPE